MEKESTCLSYDRNYIIVKNHNGDNRIFPIEATLLDVVKFGAIQGDSFKIIIPYTEKEIKTPPAVPPDYGTRGL